MQILQKQFESHQLRVIERNGQPWFVLADVCAALELSSPHKVAARLDDDERNQVPVTDSLGRSQDTTVINESGLYAVILRSDKPQAKPFRKWVTNEVLPSLRQTGSYTVGQAPVDALISVRAIAETLSITAKCAAVHMKRAGILPTHHFVTQRGNPAYLFPLPAVEAHYGQRLPAFQGEARWGAAPVVQRVASSERGKIARRHQPRLLPTDTSTEQLARRLLSLEAQKREALRELREVLRELAALA